MPKYERYKTEYPGVYFIHGTSSSGKPEKIFYISYRRNGKGIEEKAGRQFQNDMTPARAAGLRHRRINGDDLSNKERREVIQAKKNAENNRWTLNRLWEEYKLNKTDLKAKKTDEYRYNLHVRDQLGDKEPCQLSPSELDKLRRELSKTRKPQTVSHVLKLIRRIVNFGVNKQLCQGISFRIEMPRVDNLKTEDLSPTQIQKLLKVLEKEPDIQAAGIVRIALFTGMRRGEIFRLKWDDVDFHRGFIAIREPKGGENQFIPLNSQARAVLENHPHSDSPYVFPGNYGKLRVECKKPMARIKKLAGFPPGFRPLHGLRHTYASMLASSGQVDMYMLQKLLTHKTPQMTQRYAHLRDEAFTNAAKTAGDIFNEVMGKEKSSNKEKK